MRKGCYNCCIKHLSEARAVLEEPPWYPDHVMLVIGHLAQAEAEIVRFSMGLADKIRDTRLKYMDDFNADIEPELVEHFNECLALRAIATDKEKNNPLP